MNDANRGNGGAWGTIDAPDLGIAPISLPKGGGAIRGIGEKLSVNPANGTASASIPLATSPGRDGFGPQLALTYDSGSGNGPFGMGWVLPLPAITRRTDRGLPQYRDSEESDTFLLSSAEDLVPALKQTPEGEWVRDSVTQAGYRVTRYRPRIEGMFVRIERWTRQSDGDTHWRSISKTNVTTVYGASADSRIVDPGDPLRVFSWLICETRDDKGNSLAYEYVAESSESVATDALHERNRDSRVRSTQRYLKRIRYGNRQSRLVEAELANLAWLFEVVFDYGEGHCRPLPSDADGRQFVSASLDRTQAWPSRPDAFSQFRSGFEVRTYRLCRRVLTFHHFPEELHTPDYLVSATELEYSESASASFIKSARRSGFVRQDDGRYLQRSLPPIELEYSKPEVQRSVVEVDAESLQNLPGAVDGMRYQWLDLDGEGLQGILAERAGAWYFKRNVSPLTTGASAASSPGIASFEPLMEVSRLPGLARGGSRRHRFLDLAGDGQLDCVMLDPPLPGFFERTDAEDWREFTPLRSLPNIDWADSNLRFIDLDGDGHADVLISENDVFTWYRSLGEEGFAEAQRVCKVQDEEQGPTLVFADGAQTVFLADMCGDGLTGIVRIRNGEVCYWPNLGYGRFGAKVSMEGAPWFDSQESFDPKRLRLTDVDGTGTTDILYLGRQGVQLYFNEAGNRLSAPETVAFLPQTHDLADIDVVDLLGNGTACLVWSSSEPGTLNRSLRYVDLMGGRKPHLLVGMRNNRGAETRIVYAPSTRFYLADRRAGERWVTRLPFPVHVVERVETYDWITRNRFVSRYTYHHGYFDGTEREFRGFGRVEQQDTEELGALSGGSLFGSSTVLGSSTNIDAASYVPPVLTKTWFHTGAWPGDGRLSDLFAREHYREPGLSDGGARALRLPVDVLPPGLSGGEARDAIRALKGSQLRQEIYALDGSERAGHPYRVSESNHCVRKIQPASDGRPAVFLTSTRESVAFHYERRLYEIGGQVRADPRVTHEMVLEQDEFGNALRSASIAYGRRYDDADPRLAAADHAVQRRIRITFSESLYTNAILAADTYRTPLLAEARSYEVVNVVPRAAHAGITSFFAFDELARVLAQASDGQHDLSIQDFDGSGATQAHPYRRLLGHTRVLYREDDLSDSLPLGVLEPRAIPFASYSLALVPELLGILRNPQRLLPAAETLLREEGGYASGDALMAEGKFPATDAAGSWWTRSARSFLSPGIADAPAQELAYAREHFFSARRTRDPFGNTTHIRPDAYDLLPLETVDPLHNKLTAGERNDDGSISNGNDYRVLQAALVTDPNGNRSQVAFDAYGLVAGTALMGKRGEAVGDSLAGFTADLTQAQIDQFFADPRGSVAADLLQGATTRSVYDAFRFISAPGTPQNPRPTVSATIMRETHVGDLAQGEVTKRQVSLSYSDGLGRGLQQKLQAEPGPLTVGGPIVNPRWVTSGWTIVNNKGRAVRQYEPFFDDTSEFRSSAVHGVSSTSFYDPVGRVVATLHPNHQWNKVVLDPWRTEEWHTSDTVLIDDPRGDIDVGAFFARLAPDVLTEGWHARRVSGSLGALEQAAAEKAAVHAGTPRLSFFDSLGRSFLAISHNRFRHADAQPSDPATDELYFSRIILDVAGTERAVIDAKDRVVVRSDFDLRGACLHHISMEAGERWTLAGTTGQPLRSWNGRGHMFRCEYDSLRRPVRQFLQEAGGSEILVGRTEYGEGQLSDTQLNLRTKTFRTFDSAGVATTEAYDFKGNPLRAGRRMTRDFRGVVDWATDPALEARVFSSSHAFDAIDRPIYVMTPDGSEYRPRFNEANLLDRVDVRLRGGARVTPIVANIDYDARGRRALIEYGNGAKTEYSYDPETFRMTALRTTRSGGGMLQDLSYVFDAAGNITHVTDRAQQTVYYDGAVVSADNDYTYDAIGRLIGAEGREHIGQSARPQTTWNDEFRTRLPSPTDASAMRRYFEHYGYDALGNLLELRHQAAGGSWTRRFQCEDASRIEPGKYSNRLSRTIIGGDDPEELEYDAHGNITSMPHLSSMQWNPFDQLQSTSRQVVTSGGRETTFYTYTGLGQRARKVTTRADGSRRSERLYLGGLEVYREFDASGNGVTLERESLLVTDDREQIAIVETLTTEGGAVLAEPKPLVRYQRANHIGSSSLELDESGQVISYEEYHPFGSTSYQGGRSTAEVSLKRYRYTGMERDEETGLNYHGARYYASWLGRWISADPSGLQGGMNLYAYANCNPVMFSDRNGMSPVKEELPGLITDYPKLGQMWDESAVTILQNQFRKGSLEANMTAFHDMLRGLSTDPERTEAARKVFNAVRKSFYRKVGAAYDAGDKVLGGRTIDPARIARMKTSGTAPFPNAQIDHAIDELAQDPFMSLKASNLGIRAGHAGVPGGSHQRATADRARARDAGLLGKGKAVARLGGAAVFLWEAGKAGAAVADKLLHGDVKGAIEEVGRFAYDQTIGTVVDTAVMAKDIAEFVADPFGIGDAIDSLKAQQEAQWDAFEEQMGYNDPQPPPPPPQAAPPPKPRAPPRDVLLGIVMFYWAFGLAILAAQRPSSEFREEEPSTEEKPDGSRPAPRSQPDPPMCELWTPTGIPFPGIRGPCMAR